MLVQDTKDYNTIMNHDFLFDFSTRSGSVYWYPSKPRSNGSDNSMSTLG